MGRHVELTTATYLNWYEERGLLAHFKTQAEADADIWVAQRFAQWDRSTWLTPETTPKGARDAAEVYASAVYVHLDFKRFRPDASRKQTVADLFAQADGMATLILDQGLFDEDGTRIEPTQQGGRSIPIYG